MEHTLDDRNRRLHNTQFIATVEAIDWENYKLKVRRGKIVSKWLDWPACQSNNYRYNPTLKIGQQLVLASPSGDFNNAAVVGALWRPKYSAEFAPPDVPVADRPTTELVQFEDGTTLRYDSKAQKIELNTGFDVEIRTTKQLRIQSKTEQVLSKNISVETQKMQVETQQMTLEAKQMLINNENLVVNSKKALLVSEQMGINCSQNLQLGGQNVVVTAAQGLEVIAGGNIVFTCNKFIVNGQPLA